MEAQPDAILGVSWADNSDEEGEEGDDNRSQEVWLSLQNKQLRRKLVDHEKEIEDLHRKLQLKDQEMQTFMDRNSKLEILLMELRGQSEEQGEEEQLSARAQGLISELKLARMEDRFRQYIHRTVDIGSHVAQELKTFRSRLSLMKVDLARNMRVIQEALKDGIGTYAFNVECTLRAMMMDDSYTDDSFLLDSGNLSRVGTSDALVQLKVDHHNDNDTDVDSPNRDSSSHGDRTVNFTDSTIQHPHNTSATEGGGGGGASKSRRTRPRMGGSSRGAPRIDVKDLFAKLKEVCHAVSTMMSETDEFNVPIRNPPRIVAPDAVVDIGTNVQICTKTLSKVRSALHHLLTIQRHKSSMPPMMQWDLVTQYDNATDTLSTTCKELLDAMYVHKRSKPTFADVSNALRQMQCSDDPMVAERIYILEKALLEKRQNLSVFARKQFKQLARLVSLRRVLAAKRAERKRGTEDFAFGHNLLADKQLKMINTCTRCCVQVYCPDCVVQRSMSDEEAVVLDKIRQAEVDMGSLRCAIQEYKGEWVSETQHMLEEAGLVRKTPKLSSLPFARPKLEIPKSSKNYYTVLRQRRHEMAAREREEQLQVLDGGGEGTFGGFVAFDEATEASEDSMMVFPPRLPQRNLAITTNNQTLPHRHNLAGLFAAMKTAHAQQIQNEKDQRKNPSSKISLEKLQHHQFDDQNHSLSKTARPHTTPFSPLLASTIGSTTKTTTTKVTTDGTVVLPHLETSSQRERMAENRHGARQAQLRERRAQTTSRGGGGHKAMDL